MESLLQNSWIVLVDPDGRVGVWAWITTLWGIFGAAAALGLGMLALRWVVRQIRLGIRK